MHVTSGSHSYWPGASATIHLWIPTIAKVEPGVGVSSILIVTVCCPVRTEVGIRLPGGIARLSIGIQVKVKIVH